MARGCPVCGQITENLQSHMGQHSKEDVVSALMRQQEEPSTNEETSPFSGQTGPSESISSTQPPSDSISLVSQPNFIQVNNATNVGQSTPTSVGGNETKPQFQSNFGLPGVVGYVDNSALQFLAMGQAGRSAVNPFFLQQASSIQACSLQQTSVLETPTSGSFQQSTENATSTQISQSQIPQSSVSQQTPATSTQQSMVQDNQLSAGPSTLQIRKTLNNVNIVNNIGTNLQTFHPPVSNSPSMTNPASSQAGVMSTINAQGVHGSVMIPSVNMVNHMGMMGGGIMPINMMGGMPGMTSTPLLLPQVNGPTLLVNVPNYMAYQGIPNIGGMPNMVMQGIFGPQIATISSVASIPQVVVPSQVITTTTPSSLPTVVSTIQSSMSSTLVSTAPTASTTVSALPSTVEKTELKDEKKSEQMDLCSNTNEPAMEELSPRVTISEFLSESPVPGPSNLFKNEEKIENKEHCEEEMECSDIDEDEVLEKDQTEYVENKVNDLEEDDELNISQEILLDDPSHESEHPQDFNISPLPSLVSPPDRQRQTSVISHVTPSKRPRILSGSNQISAIISPRSVNAVQDSLLGSIQEDITSSLIPTTSSATTESSLSMSQFGSENPQLPQLTLNFPSILMMDSQPSSSPRTSSSVIVSPGSVSDQPPSSPTSFSFSGQQPITVDTVEALQSALACDNDVQLVVSNELLETPEFKALMQNMDQSNGLISTTQSMESTPSVSPIPSGSEFHHNEDSNSRQFTRPPQILEESNPPSPIPCSSRDISREGTCQGFDTSTDSLLPMSHGSDDDITLQDLIAVETIDESQMADDDLPWSSQLSFDSFSYISQVIGGNTFVCEKCGLHFTSLNDHRNHTSQCNRQIGPKFKKSNNALKSKNRKYLANSTITSEESKELFDQKVIDNNMKPEPGMWVNDEVISDLGSGDIKPTNLKQEPSVATQHPLGAQSKHWKCGQCKLVYESGPQLLEHLDLIKRSKIKCVPCHIVYEDRKDLIAHRRKDHPADLVRLKFDPEKEPKDEGELLDEKIYLPNEIGEYVCDTCDRAFVQKDLLIKHMSCHVELKPHECLECGKKFSKANLLREHRKRHFEEGNFQCNFCQKKFFTPNKLREHIRIHTGEAPLKCGICGKGFKRHSNLSEHKKIHEPNREVKPQKELFCHCGKVFKTQRDLDWHKEGEHEKEPKKCTYCLEVFVHSSSLTRHIRMKHEGSFMPEGKKTSLYARCPVCSQVFYKTSINKHIRVKHQGQKPYNCDICKKQFVAKCNLVNHMWQHKNQRQRPFKCTLCKKAYLREALLEQHMRSHRGIKPFVCNECGLQFTVKSNWQRHVAEHTGTRNYECPHCHKKFSRSYYLTDHLKVHTGEKPYICGICGKTAATRSNYNSHLRTHITREPVNSEV
eukprot:TRINITY_DN805_c0_g1_i1.p1 TRINITY_DN805_c0_g1~~TRINITY_DN805_c0_g1_i1.p1  ORF type:complete len:1394 (-),score=273.33 TRINITY_DN805_c0_g1_i1:540-4721(-)